MRSSMHDHAAQLHAQGMGLARGGDPRAAVPLLEQALRQAPNYADCCKPRHSLATSCRPARPRLSACNWRVSDRTEISEEHLRTRRVKLVLFVARDTIGLFMALQGFLALAAYLLHLCDPSGAIAKLYPEKWAEVAAASHLKIGPYYVCLLYTSPSPRDS